MRFARFKRLSWKAIRAFCCAAIGAYLLSRLVIPNPEFSTPTSTVVLAGNGQLMGARIADDGQWRFPEMDSVPEKFAVCIQLFEDEYFEYHPGINPISILRAMRANYQADRVVQGGSTLTMQVARLHGGNASRTVWQKLRETAMALHMEVNYSKDDIMALYASHAPFGGNVVGLDAASWRYFNRPPSELSWSECAALAVLPNAPGQIYPGKRDNRFRAKRDALLDKLVDRGYIDAQTCTLAKLENLPEKPMPLPQLAKHLVDRLDQVQHGKITSTSIDPWLQRQAQKLANMHVEKLSGSEVHNVGVVIIDVATNQIIAQVGNTNNSKTHQNEVDVTVAPRSTGSILKPILYATMLDHGEIMPRSLVPDVPTSIAGYAPKNYYEDFDGAVPASQALYRSLNVPFVHLLRQHGVDRFHHLLRDIGMRSLNKPSNHYGLSLILGGAETSLVEISSIYSSMARSLNRFNETDNYHGKDYAMAAAVSGNKRTAVTADGKKKLSAGAIYQTFLTLTQVARPSSENGWRSFKSSRKIAWKTGTSFGHRDAWSVGVTPEYVVGVWAGNANGEGRPGLTGVSAAAPLMFELYNLLGQTSWFDKPFNDMDPTLVCRHSGFRASQHCEHVDTLYTPSTPHDGEVCPYHHLVHLTANGQERVFQRCAEDHAVLSKNWFTLPPAMEWFYKKKQPAYKVLPAYSKQCQGMVNAGTMAFIYPRIGSDMVLPTELDGSLGQVVFEVAHNKPSAKLFWHLDGEYLGFTQDLHQLGLQPVKGDHLMVVTDEHGNEVKRRFAILN